MIRRVAIATAILMGFGALVAFVRAQDDGTQSVLRSINTLNQEPTLSSPPPSASRDRAREAAATTQYSIGDETGSGLPEPTPAPRSSLADRLKRLHESAASEPASKQPEQVSTPVAAPREEPAAPQGFTDASATRSERAPLLRTAENLEPAVSSPPPSRRRVARSPIPAVDRPSNQFAAPTKSQPRDSTVPTETPGAALSVAVARWR